MSSAGLPEPKVIGKRSVNISNLEYFPTRVAQLRDKPKAHAWFLLVQLAYSPRRTPGLKRCAISVAGLLGLTVTILCLNLSQKRLENLTLGCGHL